MPSQNLDTNPVEIQNFKVTINNKINLDSSISNNLNNFNLNATGFGTTLTSRSYFKQYNTITVGGYSFRNSLSASVIIEPVIIATDFYKTFLKTIITGSFLQYNNISVRQPNISRIGGSAIFLQTNTITAFANSVINVGNVFISTGSISISASPIAYQYYLLSYFDGSALSNLDSLTLSQMDYKRV
jgi:hypothetical protein